MGTKAANRLLWIDLLLGIAFLVMLALVFLPKIAASREAANRAACQGTLKQWGMIFSMYAKEWKGMYPRMQGPSPWLVDGITTSELGKDCGAEEGFRLTPNPPSVFPEYANDFDVLRCPSLGYPNLHVIRDGCKYAGNPTRADASFQYLGFILVSDDEYEPPENYHKYGTSNETLGLQLKALLEPDVNGNNAEAFSAAQWADFLLHDIPVAQGVGNAGSALVRRLQDGAIAFCMTDVNGPQKMMRGVPVMWDKVMPFYQSNTSAPQLNHEPSGSNILFEDGHVEFQRYTSDGKFPVNRELPEVLASAGFQR